MRRAAGITPCLYASGLCAVSSSLPKPAHVVAAAVAIAIAVAFFHSPSRRSTSESIFRYLPTRARHG